MKLLCLLVALFCSCVCMTRTNYQCNMDVARVLGRIEGANQAEKYVGLGCDSAEVRSLIRGWRELDSMKLDLIRKKEAICDW